MGLLHLFRRPINFNFAKQLTVLERKFQSKISDLNVSNYSQKSGNKPKKAVLILATGAEEMETVIIVDVVRRAGVTVTIAGLCGKKPVKCMNGVNIVPDTELNCLKKENFDAIILPGGFDGTMKIADSQLAGEMLKNQEKSCRIIGAICAAPLALNKHCIAHGKSLTSYPAVKNELEHMYKYKDENVVIDDSLITSRGPGTTFEFALSLAEMLSGKEVAEKVASDILMKFQSKKCN